VHGVGVMHFGVWVWTRGERNMTAVRVKFGEILVEQMKTHPRRHTSHKFSYR